VREAAFQARILLRVGASVVAAQNDPAKACRSFGTVWFPRLHKRGAPEAPRLVCGCVRSLELSLAGHVVKAKPKSAVHRQTSFCR
jgi:hypothetical protein